jgi:beta-1,2-mannosidase
VLVLYFDENTADPLPNCFFTITEMVPEGMCPVGEALFYIKNPEILLGRTDNFVLCPTLPHEITGQYAAGTTLAEGLVFFKGKWFLYYGTADSFVGLVVSKK